MLSHLLLLAQVAQPCTTPTTLCEGWVRYDATPARSMVYTSYPLAERNPGVTRALIMVHGAGRNADHYFATAMAAAFLVGALQNTIVIAPRFVAAGDKTSADEVIWPNSGNSWRGGGVSPSHAGVTSFDFVDRLVRLLADKRTFPNLAKIVVAGHSAGGQLATRYAMVNKVDGLPGVTLSYVVANPSSYAWPVAVRPLPTGTADPATADKEALGPNGEKVNGDSSSVHSMPRRPLDSIDGRRAWTAWWDMHRG